VISDKRSLLLITVDCLRADHCGVYGYPKPTTPFLDSLASESFVVPAAIVAGAPTYYSFPAMLASRMPLALGRDVIGIAPGESTLATVLHEAGHATAAWLAGNPYLSPRFGYHQGFDIFQDFLDFEAHGIPKTVSPKAGWGDLVRRKLNRTIQRLAGALGLTRFYDELYFQYCIRIAPAVATVDALRRYPGADVLVDRAQSWLASVGQRPFFLWLHLMDPHSPYYPSSAAFRDLAGRDIEPGRARYLNAYWSRFRLTPSRLLGKRDEVVELYDAGIRWLDGNLARLVESLRQTRQWDNCVFALTADHGEEFLEHGGRYHLPSHLSEEMVRVPLLIRVPGERAGKVPVSPMSHLHLAPTLLEIVGVEAPSAFQGRSLWRNLQRGIAWDDPAIIECTYGCANPFRMENRNVARLLGIRDERFKLVMRLLPGAIEEVYDLEADPGERKRISDELAIETRKRLLRAAREHLQKTVAARDPEMRLRARLRDLGLEWKSNTS
jgi:arylsulfatase A-like enzyme